MLPFFVAVFGLGMLAGALIGTYMALDRAEREFAKRLELARRYGVKR